jgi:ATP-dependent DNA ligase
MVHKDYLGFNRSIQPRDLHRFEDSSFVLEEKFNGWWCVMYHEQGDTQCFSRQNKDLAEAAAILGTGVHPRVDSVLVGEWMPKEKIIWLFDLLYCDGRNYRYEALSKRRAKLESVVSFFDPDVFRVVAQHRAGFYHTYKSIVDDGGEGVALKNEHSLYISRLASKKTSHWIKCKPGISLPIAA